MEWVLQLSAPYLQVWGCLCEKGPIGLSVPVENFQAHSRFRLDTPSLAGIVSVLFCIKKKKGMQPIKTQEKSHKIPKILRLPTNPPLWNMRKDLSFLFCVFLHVLCHSHTLYGYTLTVFILHLLLIYSELTLQGCTVLSARNTKTNQSQVLPSSSWSGGKMNINNRLL